MRVLMKQTRVVPVDLSTVTYSAGHRYWVADPTLLADLLASGDAVEASVADAPAPLTDEATDGTVEQSEQE